MKFNAEINKYLAGELFSSGIDIPFFDEKYPNETRLERIIKITKGKRVIHVGCADHLPLIETKIKNKKWLHGLLTESTAQCIGIDNNEEAVDYINHKLGIKNVYLSDITIDKFSVINDSRWDYMILGELIEHVDNPVAFLSEIREKYKGKVDKILITAPNIFNILTINDIRKNVENINTDHRYWFSPYTLTKITLNSGFQNCELFFSERVKLPLVKAAIRRLKLLFGKESTFKANCFSTMILIASFEK